MEAWLCLVVFVLVCFDMVAEDEQRECFDRCQDSNLEVKFGFQVGPG
jgi:hypothetical protein